jgi:hypothetical protein
MNLPVGDAVPLKSGGCVLRSKGLPMLNDVQQYVSVFAHLTIACTFGLSLAIGIAGVSNSPSPFACQICKTQAVALSAIVRRV